MTVGEGKHENVCLFVKGMNIMEEMYVQLRGLNESIYCEKLFYMMYVQGIFMDNKDTIEGSFHHKKREDTDRNHSLGEADIFTTVLYAMDGTLSAKLDGVIKENGEYIPVEDKNSKIPEKEYECILWGIKIKTQIWVNDFPQIVGQMYLLRKNNYPCTKGRVYYRGSNKMIELEYKTEFAGNKKAVSRTPR